MTDFQRAVTERSAEFIPQFVGHGNLRAAE
jgi:hypothetical protein